MNLDVLPGEEADVVYDEQVARVGHGDVKGIAHKPERNGLVFMHDIQRNQACDFFVALSLDKFTWGQWNCLAINSKRVSSSIMPSFTRAAPMRSPLGAARPAPG